MSQNTTTIHRKTRKLLLGAALIGMGFPAQSAINPGLKVQPATAQTHTVTLSELTGTPARILDWRSPRAEFRFDLPPSDRVTDISLELSADPVAEMQGTLPVYVQLNNGPAVPVLVRGQGFSASVPLNPANMMARRNTVRITTAPPRGHACLGLDDGGWDLDLAGSALVVRARAKSRSVHLRDVSAALTSIATAPERVSIYSPSDDPRHQALVAQGVALHMEGLPDFTTGPDARGDLDILVGLRHDLAGRVKDANILKATGARIHVDRSHQPMRLVLTADDPAGLDAVVEAFASHPLPRAGRAVTSPGELALKGGFAGSVLEPGRVRLSDLGATDFAPGWAATPLRVQFDVADPAASHGELVLKLSNAETVAPDSHIDIRLNGRSLGRTALDSPRQTLRLPIQAGWLVGTDNRIEIVPELTPTARGCTAAQTPPRVVQGPDLHLGRGSYLRLSRGAASPATELSRLAAGGGPLTDERGAQTTVVLLGDRRSRDASLKVVAKLAQATGRGLIAANYDRNVPDAGDVLVLGPRADRDDDAPRALDLALSGRSVDLGGRRITGGGVAAIYPQGDRLVGLVSTVRPVEYVARIDDLVANWNQLEGGVMRWHGGDSLMAQTAIDLPNALDRAQDLRLPTPIVPEFEMLRGERLTSLTDGVRTRVSTWGRKAHLAARDVRVVTRRWLGEDIIRLRGLYDYSSPTNAANGNASNWNAPNWNAWGRGASEGAELKLDTVARAGIALPSRASFRDADRAIKRWSKRTRARLGWGKPDLSWEAADHRFSLPALLIFVVSAFTIIGLTSASSGVRGGRN